MSKMLPILVFVFITSFICPTPAVGSVVPSQPLRENPTAGPSQTDIRSALSEFKSLPGKEKKYRLKEAKKAIREFKKEKKKGMEPSTETLLLVIIALFIPPLAVYLHQGETNNKFWITTLLFVAGLLGALFIGWALVLASIIYALIVILGNS